MMGTLRGFTRQCRRPTLLTARASGALPPHRADASDGRLDPRLACAHARAGNTKPGCSQTRQGAAPQRGVGGLNPWRRPPCYRPSPHAEISFSSRNPLIIFFEIKQSNGGALSPERQCKLSQAVTCGISGGEWVLDGFARICFRSPFGPTRGAVKSSASSRSGTAWLIRTQNLEIEYRKPTTGCRETRGRFNPARFVGLGPRSGSTHFRGIRIYFFLRLTSTASGEDTQKIAAKFRVGGWVGDMTRKSITRKAEVNSEPDRSADRLRLEFWPVDRLVPSARNARTHSDAQVAEIAGSIRAFGFTNPILVGEHGDIVAGHGRLAAARQLGLSDVPVILLQGLTELQRRQLVLADNRIALNAGWDLDMLNLELKDLSALGADLSLVGFTAHELAAALAPAVASGLTDENDAPALGETAVTHMGDVWGMGSHRLACGDSTDGDAVGPCLAGCHPI
jgi:ParB-like nuclease domain